MSQYDSSMIRRVAFLIMTMVVMVQVITQTAVYGVVVSVGVILSYLVMHHAMIRAFEQSRKVR